MSLPDARPDAVADLARYRDAEPISAEIDAGLPVAWFGEPDWRVLPRKGTGANEENNERWAAFHERFPGSSGWLSFSAVGFSNDGRQAVLHARTASASLDSEGSLVLLEKVGRRWRLRHTVVTSEA